MKDDDGSDGVINAAALPRATLNDRHVELRLVFYVSGAVAQTVTESDLRNVGFRDATCWRS